MSPHDPDQTIPPLYADDAGETVALGATLAPGATGPDPALTGPALTDPALTDLGLLIDRAADPLAFSEARADRYEVLGLLGVGGMGEVHRVRDRLLQRTLAMKVLPAARAASERTLARFVEEAQVAAQLHHPGVVPVHDLGRLADGRLFFTMQEVRGRTLASIFRDVHLAAAANAAGDAASEDPFAGAQPAPGGWTQRRLVDAYLRVCETVAYAHARGVVHRDLKPGNIMVGTYGRVQVLDWGLARVLGLDLPPLHGDDAVVSSRSGRRTLATAAGSVTGTPAYMAPEQALAQLDSIGPPTDVYALGAVLYELLSGRPPYVGPAERVVAMVQAGPPPPLSPGPDRPAALVELCAEAMQRDPEDRPADAEELAEAVRAWLDGAVQRERALELVERADALAPELAALRDEARALHERAAALLADVPEHAEVARKAPGWALEDRARDREATAQLVETEWMQALQSALTASPDLPEARRRLADWYRARHAAAEAALDHDAMLEAERMLRVHDRGWHARYLDGAGRLSLRTTPPGARVTVQRYVERGRRLVAEPFAHDGGDTAPLVDLALPMGSYRLLLEHPGHHPVVLPVCIQRQEHWQNRPPGAADALPVPLPPTGSLGPDDCFVPAGWFQAGDPDAHNAVPRQRIWVDGFVMQRFPVTNRDFLRFLRALDDRGQAERASRLAPGAAKADDAASFSGYRRVDGCWTLGADSDGETWLPDWPVFRVTWDAAMAYAAWMAETTGLPWRLPLALEWEKAARGVDGRPYPWGRHFDATWACSKHSRAEGPAMARVGDYDTDIGPYGLRGMAGNTNDWCLDGPDDDALGPWLEAPATLPERPGLRWIRGGAAGYSGPWCRVAVRLSRDPAGARDVTGFRLLRPWPPPLLRTLPRPENP